MTIPTASAKTLAAPTTPITPRPRDTDAQSSLLSVVIPVYNEVLVLPALVDLLRAVLERTSCHWEIVFVNDGSRDGSGEMLDRLAGIHRELRVVHLSRNFGHQAAVHAGLSNANGDAVVIMDSDMQDSPQAIPRMIDEWLAGYDVVYAVRVERKERAWKRFLFNSFHRMLSAVSTTAIPADAGNFSLMDRRVVDHILALSDRDRYLPGLRAWVGFQQRGIEVERLARYDDQPRVSLSGLFRLAKTAIFSFSTLPIKMFYLIAFTAMTVCAVVTCVTFYIKLTTDAAIPGWTSSLVVASFFGALNALGIGILGEYVVRIFDQVRARPLFIVESSSASNRTTDSCEIATSSALLRQSNDLLAMTGQQLEATTIKQSAPIDAAQTEPVQL